MLKFSVKNLIDLLLSPKGRIKRIPYLFGIFLVAIIYYNLSSAAANFVDEIQSLFIAFTVVIFVLLIILWPFLVFHIKRLHDVNLSGWFSLIALIPFINFLFFLFLLFRKSVEPNKYRASSADNQKF